MNHEQINRAINAWQLCDASTSWSLAVDAVMCATWKGRPIAWLGFEGELFEIFTVDDSKVIDEAQLSAAQAHRLSWDAANLTAPIFLPHARLAGAATAS